MPDIPKLGRWRQEDQQFYRPRLYEISSQKTKTQVKLNRNKKKLGGGVVQAEKQLLIHLMIETWTSDRSEVSDFKNGELPGGGSARL